MLSQCLPASFIKITVQEQITTEDFFKMVTMAAIMDTILIEMLKMWKVTDGQTDEGRTIVNRPLYK